MANDRFEYAKRVAQACGAGKGCLVVGTDHFVSTEAVIAHCRGDWAAAKAKIASGEIKIGEPTLVELEELGLKPEPGWCLVLLPNGQYGIKID